jgi:hypothetical protein
MWYFAPLFFGFEYSLFKISRKASTTYYPTLHLELARYITHASQAGYELPYTISRLIGLPPPALAKNPSSGRNTPARQTPLTPTKRGGPPPVLPSPKKIEPVRFE